MQRQKQICIKCDSTVNKKPIEEYVDWQGHSVGCSRRKAHFRYHPKGNPRRITFKGKRVFLTENPRTGECSHCHRKVGEGIQKTQMHHIKYHKDDPLKDTVELCSGCHSKAHAKIRKKLKIKKGKEFVSKV